MMPATDDSAHWHDLIMGMPKAELHIHVEATLEAEMLLEIADRNEINLGYPDEAAVREAYQFEDLVDFLNTYYRHLGVLRTEQDFSDLTHAYARRAVAQGVRRFELFFDPQAHTRRGIAFEVVASGIDDGLRRARADFDVSAGLLMCFLRDEPVDSAHEVLDVALRSDLDILGVGLDSAEVGFPPSLFVDVYQRARAAGLRAVAHAGEEGPPAYIWQAIEQLGVERVDHGVRSIRDSRLVSYLAEHRLPLTTCPLSNVRLGVFETLQQHSVLDLLRAGCCATINADGPAYFDGYVGDNYIAVVEAFGPTWGEVIDLAANSFEACFIREEDKSTLRDELSGYVTSTGIDELTRIRPTV